MVCNLCLALHPATSLAKAIMTFPPRCHTWTVGVGVGVGDGVGIGVGVGVGVGVGNYEL
jgi:hypothetical protein